MSKSTKKETRKDFHHLGSPEVLEASYCKENCEYMIAFAANGSNTHFMGDHIQTDDILYLGLSEQQFEALSEMMLGVVADRLKEKLERYNSYLETYYTTELQGTKKEFKKSVWNRLNSTK